ncbi:hypothetical protein DdX_13979 [Ditylenchus destructor]|uniref:Uncharacterized protein n=1 Tax=Ditylenchus destructor TaxID=166010 RepID=A0AAD4MSN4_9BILA|nr:hypothetical protein DdX_13979 [Ditylenchus destructor]
MVINFCQPNPEKIKAEETKLALRNTASTSSDNTRAVVSNTLVGLSPATLVSLPKFTSLHKVVQRKRKADNPMPIKIPHTIQEIPNPIPANLCLTKTSSPQPFVLFDSGKENPSRIIMFASQYDISKLSQCNTWLIDGTSPLLQRCLPSLDCPWKIPQPHFALGI